MHDTQSPERSVSEFIKYCTNYAWKRNERVLQTRCVAELPVPPRKDTRGDIIPPPWENRRSVRIIEGTETRENGSGQCAHASLNSAVPRNNDKEEKKVSRGIIVVVVVTDAKEWGGGDTDKNDTN